MNSSDENLLTREEILAAPDEDYMNDDQLAFFKQLLFELHESTVAHIKDAKQQMTSSHDTSDVSDLASWEEQSAISLRIVDREQKLLPKIQQSLERIRLGTYGYCLESDEPIGIKRLLARPTAEYCAEIKTMKEMKEDHYKS